MRGLPASTFTSSSDPKMRMAATTRAATTATAAATRAHTGKRRPGCWAGRRLSAGSGRERGASVPELGGNWDVISAVSVRVEGGDHRADLARGIRRARGDDGIQRKAAIPARDDDEALGRAGLRAGEGVDQRTRAVQARHLRADLVEVGVLLSQARLQAARK